MCVRDARDDGGAHLEISPRALIRRISLRYDDAAPAAAAAGSCAVSKNTGMPVSEKKNTEEGGVSA